jgi:hypothetical protein
VIEVGQERGATDLGQGQEIEGTNRGQEIDINPGQVQESDMTLDQGLRIDINRGQDRGRHQGGRHEDRHQKEEERIMKMNRKMPGMSSKFDLKCVRIHKQNHLLMLFNPFTTHFRIDAFLLTILSLCFVKSSKFPQIPIKQVASRLILNGINRASI